MKLQVSLLAIAFTVASITTNAQTAPAGRYDTTSYPEERKAIEIMSRIQDTSKILNGDYIGVGAEGRISYSYYDQAHKGDGWKVKSITPVPGKHFLRVYNGDAAVRNVMVDVVFDTPKGEFPIQVIRTETYIKQHGKWYYVSGQGTRVMTDQEIAEGYNKAVRPKKSTN